MHSYMYLSPPPPNMLQNRILEGKMQNMYVGGLRSKFPIPVMREKHIATLSVFPVVLVVVKQVGTKSDQYLECMSLRRISIQRWNYH